MPEAKQAIANVCQVSSFGFNSACRNVGKAAIASITTTEISATKGELNSNHKSSPPSADSWQITSNRLYFENPNLNPKSTMLKVQSVELNGNRHALKPDPVNTAAVPMLVNIVHVSHETILGLVFLFITSTIYGATETRLSAAPRNTK
jgi:hypothetical protein